MHPLTAVACALLAWSSGNVEAEETEYLPEMIVCESRHTDALPTGTGSDTTDLYAHLPDLRMAPQGIGAQTDLTIQGSSFSGAGLSLGGLALRNPQTEHFHSELPLAALLFERPRVLTGLQQSLHSTGHLVGSVDLEFAPAAERGSVEAGVGETRHDWQSVFWQDAWEMDDRGELGLSVFANREWGAGDDPPANHVDRYLAGSHLQFRSSGSQLDVAVGHQSKTFGAQGFYGAPTTLPSLETVRDTLVVATWQTGDKDDAHTRLSGTWRRISDTYTLDRDRPYLYENQHDSTVAATSADGRQPITDDVALRWRLELEEERLDSSYEGTYPASPLGNHQRARGGLAIMPELQLGCWRTTVGIRPLFFEDDRPAYLPVAGIEGRPFPGHVVHLSYSESVRQPSYTELNYDSPGSLGNQGLDRQHNATLEAGWRREREGIGWHILAFGRRERDAVDWTKATPASRWVAENLGQVDTHGLDIGLNLPLPHSVDLQASYAYLHKSAGDTPYASRYVLDYPRHSFQVGLSWRLRDWCELRMAQVLRRQVNNRARNGDTTAVDGTVQLVLTLPGFPGSRVTVSVHNLWDDDFEPLPGQPPAGRRVSAALGWDW